MSVISLTESEPFDALSYVWGDPSVREGAMICNGHHLNITLNLWTALRQTWRNWPTKKVWADAICINQEDIAERNQQVTIMGTIYSKAEHVTVSFGLAIQQRRTDSALAEDINQLAHISKSASEIDREDLFGDILSRPWFWRAWTLQEVKLARIALLCCGSLHEDFSLLSRAISEYNDSQPMAKVCGLDFINNQIPEVADNITLFHLLVESSTREASDPRDKCYVLLLLLHKDLYGFIAADYSLSEEETVI
ncbi:heterokaryon incompatibility protein-domain-containing protein [Xylogone sp. PMI_703]|nr:heterokaryon incompatibility protein-domain-containing protein [Xylogone sp. PMI_703]